MLHELKKLKISLSVSIVPDPKLPIAASTSPNGAMKRAFEESEDEVSGSGVDTRAISLGSRKQLCINEKLKAKAGDLDEACRQRLSGEAPQQAALSMHLSDMH